MNGIRYGEEYFFQTGKLYKHLKIIGLVLCKLFATIPLLLGK
uniref:Uncharacterized protein n=1 Tax=Rhizophora mucronata TaxID=61149 RepID=A0A2P2N8T7_RHIMU